MLEAFARTWQALAAEHHSGLDRFVTPGTAGQETPLDLSSLRLTRQA